MGRLIGGNLWSIADLCGMPCMPEIRQGDIMFIEDTETWADGLENFLAKLKICGIFDKIGGLIISKCRGDVDCETEKTYYDFIYDYIGRPDYPVLAEFDFSHNAPMLTMPIGIMAELDADAKAIRLVR